MPIEIIPLSKKLIPDVAGLHMKYLHTPFKDKPGGNLLEVYYSTLTEQVGGCGYVAVDDNNVAGYICGVWDPKKLRKILLKKHWWPLLINSIKLLGLNPNLIIDYASRFLKKDDYNDIIDSEGYELRPIVVDGAYHGSQVSSMLVAQLFSDARKRGYKSIFLITEVDNLPANKFYKKQGFLLFNRSTRTNIYKRDL